MLYRLGEDLQLRGRLDEAEQKFNAALDVYSTDPLALCDKSAVLGDLAYVKEMRGDVQAALQSINSRTTDIRRARERTVSGHSTNRNSWLAR